MLIPQTPAVAINSALMAIAYRNQNHPLRPANSSPPRRPL